MTSPDLASAAAPLRNKFKGHIYVRGDVDFEQAAHGGLWNKMVPPRMPEIIAVANDADDVVIAVNFARTNGMKVAVRGGGHNWCQPTLRSSGILIDLRNLTGVVSVDAEARVAIANPIVSNRELQAALHPHGLAFPTGHCPEVKISGYLLSGGMSWNQGAWGHGIESVEAIEMVTPGGELIVADEHNHRDYFWAARGAGPGMFAVATRFHLRLHPLPRAIFGSTYFYSMGELASLGEWLESVTPTMASNVELSVFLLTAPRELAERCEDHGGTVAMVTATAFADSEEEARTALEPLEGSPVPLLSRSVGVTMTFEALFDLSGALWPPDHRNVVDAMFSNAPLADLLTVAGGHFQQVPSPTTVLLFAAFTGPNVPALLPDAAFSMSTRYYGGPWTMWQGAENDAANLSWREKCIEALRPLASGHYVGESDMVTYPQDAQGAYLSENWQRLKELRSQHDPDGLFFDYAEGLR